MAHRIDAEHDSEGGQAAVVTLRPAPRARPAVQPVPLRVAQGEPQVSRKRLWDKNNFGFWLVVCILISLAFSFVYRALV